MEREFKSDVLNDLKDLVNENELLKKQLKEGAMKFILRRPNVSSWFRSDLDEVEVEVMGHEIPIKVIDYLNEHENLIVNIEKQVKELDEGRKDHDKAIKESTSYIYLEEKNKKLIKEVETLKEAARNSEENNLKHLILLKTLKIELLNLSVWNVYDTKFKLVENINNAIDNALK